MFEAQQETLSQRTHRYTIRRDKQLLTFAQVLEYWQEDTGFRTFFITLLANSPFSAYRWETPPVTAHSTNRPFEFILNNSPELARPPDRAAFAAYFTEEESVAVMENLGRDALLIVPAPRTTDSVYVHLASFLREAPDPQKQALWRRVGQSMQQRLGSVPSWLSTAGGGVAWLHIRIDSRPKYYSYSPYRIYP